MDRMHRGRTRRELLRLLGVVGIGSLAAACAPAAPPQPTAAPKAAAPTTAPVPAPTTAAKPTSAPASAPTAAAAPKPTAAPAVAADFYKDKSIRLIVGWEPGTSTDTQARYFAQELPKFIPGNPRMAVTNQPGAGAMIAVNGMWTARPDGLTMAYGPGAGPVDQLQRFEEAKYEYNGFVRAFTFEIEPASGTCSAMPPTSASRRRWAATGSSPSACCPRPTTSR
jgi:hypothetical protein